MLSLSALAQAPDTLHLPEIRVTDLRLGRPDSLMAYRIDRLPMSARHASLTVGDALLRTGSVVRGYGPGVLQTVAYRGFAASQTQVLWNGWALNHGMVGVSDLSLIPAFLIDEMVLNRAGGSAEYGNAAIGGTLELDAEDDGGSALHLGGGSYGAFSLGAKTTFTADGWDQSLGVFRRTARNDFPYTDVFRVPIVERRRRNASTELNSVMLTRRQHVDGITRHLSLWLSGADNEIPGPISAGGSEASQTDLIQRIHGGLSTRFGRGWVGGDALMSIHRLDFLDPATDTDSRSRLATLGFRGFYAQPGFRMQADLRSTGVEFTEYVAPRRHEASLSGTWLRGGSQLSARLDHDSFYGWFWSGSLGHRTRHFRAHVARSFGVPTFNDLYWPLLGNPSLIPETAIKGEAGWVGRMGFIHWDVPLFAARVTDGIQWMPQSDGRVRPTNLRDIRSFGAEPTLRLGLDGGPWRLDVLAQATYTRARYGQARFPGDRSVNRRVAYVPEWQALAEAAVTWGSFTFTPTVRHTGERFTTEDERLPLPSVTLWDFDTGALITAGGLRLTLNWRIENVFDQEHSLIRWYPMPGRQHHISLQFTIP
jgi:iron complex outermembrane receptor protein